MIPHVTWSSLAVRLLIEPLDGFLCPKNKKSPFLSLSSSPLYPAVCLHKPCRLQFSRTAKVPSNEVRTITLSTSGEQEAERETAWSCPPDFLPKPPGITGVDVKKPDPPKVMMSPLGMLPVYSQTHFSKLLHQHGYCGGSQKVSISKRHNFNLPGEV